MPAPELAAFHAEIDHIFILCDLNAPESSALIELGFEEGSSNTHPHQGTACRRFFFQNAYLELLWVHHPEEAQSEASRHTGLWERWSNRRHGACPFGVILRPSNSTPQVQPPFPTWSYRPAYLPPGLSIEISSDTTLDEPAFFWLPFHRDPLTPTAPGRHRNGRAITGISIRSPGGTPRGKALQFAEEQGLITFEAFGEHLLELTLDHGSSQKTADLRKSLPLSLHW